MPEPHADRSLAVLIVDDPLAPAEGVESALIARGCTVTRTAAGPAAFETADRIVPDAVLIILTRAAADISSLIEQWRGDAVIREVPIVVRTEITRRHALEHLLAIGAAEIVIDRDPAAAADAVVRVATSSPERRTLRRLRRALAGVIAAPAGAGNPDPLGELFTAMQTSPVPLVAADRIGRCVAVNDAACRLSGYALDDVLGHHLWEFAPIMQRPLTLAAWSALTTTGTFEGHLKLRRPDHSVVPIFVSATTHVVPGIHVGVIEPVATAAAV